MTKYIFDLDKCLYFSNSQNTHKTKKTNIKIKKLLNELKGDKFIFSNATTKYVKYALKSMKIEKVFVDIATKSDFFETKPNKIPYKYVIKKFNIKRLNFTIFFDDKINNLKTAKEFGWYTVLISPENERKYKYIDFQFQNIEIALNFFIMYNT